jgi:benzil reductase ((S)-benzoin forming)
MVSNYYYITGTSRGIGKALAMHLLEDASNNVIGISRHCTIEAPNYEHISLDLSDANVLMNFKFEPRPTAGKIYLINNAGAIGEVKPLGKLQPESIIKDYTVNLIAPTVLSNAFIKTYNDINAEKAIINISSGASKNPVDGWSVYCASKAGINMMSRVVSDEQKMKVSKSSYEGVYIFAIEPGIVNTAMQAQIRKANPEDFSRLNEFIAYHENDQLADPDLLAQKFMGIFQHIHKLKNVVFSVADYD